MFRSILIAALIVSVLLAGSAPAHAVPGLPDSLHAGQSLGLNQQLVSGNGQYYAIQQSDGNFVVYFAAWKWPVALWGSSTQGHTEVQKLVMQDDGDLVMFNKSGEVMWSSDTAGNPGAYLIMQGDGNLVIYQSDHKTPIWATKTAVAQRCPAS